jgi:hypothetical protein
MARAIHLIFLLVSLPLSAADFYFHQAPLSGSLKEKIRKYSWREGCPVGLDELVQVTLSHYGFDGQVHQGQMIVHRQVAEDLRQIFRILFQHRFPIEKIRLIDEYRGDDRLSMEDNNTSAFNCRYKNKKEKIFSPHAFGCALDINPVQNPFVFEGRVVPEQGKEFLDRRRVRPGMITPEDIVHRTFRRFGWRWGGKWLRGKDYQHFEKLGCGEPLSAGILKSYSNFQEKFLLTAGPFPRILAGR